MGIKVWAGLVTKNTNYLIYLDIIFSNVCDLPSSDFKIYHAIYINFIPIERCY